MSPLCIQSKHENAAVMRGLIASSFIYADKASDNCIKDKTFYWYPNADNVSSDSLKTG